MRVTVLWFANTAELAGGKEQSVEIADDATVGDLRTQLGDGNKRLAEAIAASRIAVNEDFADDETVLSDGDTVAMIPPVSGG